MKFFRAVVISSFCLIAISCGRFGEEYSTSKVINGIIDNSSQDRDGVNLAVARLLLGKGSSTFTCTGTRVAKDLILTAAHCLDSESGKINSLAIGTGFAPNVDILRDQISYSKWETHPKFENPRKFDIGLIRIASSEVAKLDQLNLKIARVSFSQVEPYTDVTMYGYGCPANGAGIDGNKRYGKAFMLDSSLLGNSFDLVHVTPSEGFDPTEARLCGGDSGGPLVLDGRVIGTNAGVSDNYSYYTRLDLNEISDWYARFRDNP